MMAHLFSNIFVTSIALGLITVLLLSLEKREAPTIMGFLGWAAVFLVGQKAIEVGTEHLPKNKPQTVAEQLTGPVTLTLKDSAAIISVAVTPDGQTAVTDTATFFHVWDIKTGQERWTSPYTGFATLSNSGKYLLVRCNDCRTSFKTAFQLYDTVSGTLLANLQNPVFNPNASIKYKLFNHNDTYLLLGSDKMEVVIYKLDNLGNTAESSSSETPTLPAIVVPREIPENTFGLPPSYSHMGFNGDGQSLFVHAFDTLEKWSIEAQPRLLASHRFEDNIKFKPSKFSDDGKMVFYCEDTGIRLADAYATLPSEIKQLAASSQMPPGSYYISHHCAMSPNDQWIALGISENSGNARFVYGINIWNTDGTLALNDTAPKPENADIPQVNAMAYSPDSTTLYVADEAMRLHVYDLSDTAKPAILNVRNSAEFKNVYSSTVLLASSNHGVLLSYHGASKAVWIPTDKPDDK